MSFTICCIIYILLLTYHHSRASPNAVQLSTTLLKGDIVWVQIKQERQMSAPLHLKRPIKPLNNVYLTRLLSINIDRKPLILLEAVS